MSRYSVNEIVSLTVFHGRTFVGENALWCNWTTSGLTVRFEGSWLKAVIRAIPEKLPSPPGFPPMPTDYPWIGVVQDGQLRKRIKGTEDREEVILFEGAPGEHEIRIVKLSENARGKIGLLSLETDGNILPCVQDKKLTIEFVGDSITCGYGNEAPGKDSPFVTDEENGWISYGAVCSRILGAEGNMISVSGISTSQPEESLFPFRSDSMDELYAYTDLMGQRRLGIDADPWNFSAHPKDVVILDLGTNDVNPIRFAPDFDRAAREEIHFRKVYRAFLEQVRRLNGPSTLIGCTLGPLDYYLFDDILEVVREYKEETKDEQIFVYKFIGVNLMKEGFGADQHPSALTHERMGRELAGVIRNELEKRNRI